MKIVTTILVLVSLLSSAQVVACSVYIIVQNYTGVTLENVKVKGPYSRRSSGHTLKNGASFKYHATGSMFSCHGAYHLTDAAGDPYCDMSEADESDNTLYFSSDGTGCFDIEKSTDRINSDPNCTVSSYRCTK